MEVYLDHAATSPMSEEALATYVEAVRAAPANPASGHAAGAIAKHQLELARSKAAQLFGMSEDEVLFTSGATESMNWAISAVAARPGVVFATPIEHSCAMEPLKRLGDRVVWLPMTPSGKVDFSAAITSLKACSRNINALIVMGANNETGVIQPVRELASLVKRLNPLALVVSDLVAMASWGGVADAMEWVDFGVLSPHKVGGPVGVGVVLRRRGAEITPFVIGGAQEYDMRAGTVSVPLVVGGVEALSAAVQHSEDHRLICRSLQDRLERGLADLDGNVVVVGTEESRVGITSAVFTGLRAEDILFLLDEQGVRASAGAACASGAMQPSHVLLALGYPREDALAQVRFSYASSLSESEIDYAIDAVDKVVTKLRPR